MKQRWPILLLGAAIVASTALLLYLGRDQTPIVDQWGYLYGYRSWSFTSLLTPHNGHLIVLPLVVYKAMFAAFGLESQLPYQLVTLALSATVAVLLFTLIRNAVGDILALAAATLILFYGAGADVILPTFQFTNLIGLASGLGMLLALRRESTGGDAVACLLLAMSLASFSIGVAFAIGAALALALRPPGRRLGRVWVVVIPVAAYVVWLLWARKYHQQNIYVHNLKILGSALVDQVSAALAGITGLFTTPNGPSPEANPVPIRTDWGRVLVAGLAALLIVRLRRPPKPSRNAIVAVAVLVVYLLSVAIALNMFRNTSDTRLVYLASVLGLLAVAELCAPYRPGRTALVVVGVVFVFSMCANIAELSDKAEALRSQSATIRAKLTAVELAEKAVPDVLTTVEDPPGAMNFNIDQFREFEADFGLPTYSEEDLVSASSSTRQTADEELIRVLEVKPRPAPPLKPFSASRAPLVRAVAKGDAKQDAACLTLTPQAGARMEALIELPPGGLAYSSPAAVEVFLGRFADEPTIPLPPQSGSIAIRIPADASDVPWLAAIVLSAPTLVCPADGLA